MVPRQLPPEGSEEEQLSDSISSKNLKWPIGMAWWDPWQHHAAIVHCHTQGWSQQAGHLAAGRSWDEAGMSTTLLEISPPGLTPSTQNTSNWHQQSLQRAAHATHGAGVCPGARRHSVARPALPAL